MTNRTHASLNLPPESVGAYLKNLAHDWFNGLRTAEEVSTKFAEHGFVFDPKGAFEIFSRAN